MESSDTWDQVRQTAHSSHSAFSNHQPALIWAVVPAKDLGQAKGRLTPVLTPLARERLMLRLLRGTMAALAGVPALTGWLVVSRDERLLALGVAAGGVAVRERGT